MKLFIKTNDNIERIISYINILLMSVLIITVFIDVLVRYVYKKPIIWSTEVSLICFIWLIFLGSSIAVRHRRHYVVEIIPLNWVKTNIILDIVADIASFALLYIMVFNGFNFAKMGMIRYTTSLALPQTVIFAAIPVAGIVMTLFNIEQLIKNVRKLVNHMNKKDIIEGDDILESNRAING